MKDLVTELSQKLKINEAQAQSGAAILFKAAKDKLGVAGIRPDAGIRSRGGHPRSTGAEKWRWTTGRACLTRRWQCRAARDDRLWLFQAQHDQRSGAEIRTRHSGQSARQGRPRYHQ